MKLLIVRGYGTFGGRIVQLLESEPRLTLLVAGRSLAKAEAYCKGRGGTKSRLVPIATRISSRLARTRAGFEHDRIPGRPAKFQATRDRAQGPAFPGCAGCGEHQTRL